MQEVREHILHCERILLHVLGFDFQVDHPHAYIMRLYHAFIVWFNIHQTTDISITALDLFDSSIQRNVTRNHVH